MLLLAAGFETTVNLLGNGAALLMAHPDQLAALRAGPASWATATDEVLRFDSPVQRTGPARAPRHRGRRASGCAAGQLVVLILGGANRDPAVFADPQRFDVTRRDADRHVAFSQGHPLLPRGGAGADGGRDRAARAVRRGSRDLALAGAPHRRATRLLRGYDAMPVTARTPPVRAEPRRGRARLRRLHRARGRQPGSGRTSSARRRARSASGSAVRPVCTGPGCTIVLRGAVRRRNRRPRSSSPAGPARRASSGPPAHTVCQGAQHAGDPVGVGARVQGVQAGLVEVHAGAEVVQAAAVEQHAGVDRLAALDPRHHAERGVLERMAGHVGRRRSPRRRTDRPPRGPGGALRDRVPQRGSQASRASRRASSRAT